MLPWITVALMILAPRLVAGQSVGAIVASASRRMTLLNGNVTIYCNLLNTTAPAIVTLLQTSTNAALSPSSQTSSTATNVTYQFDLTGVAEADAGEYQCTAQIPPDRVLRDSLLLTVTARLEDSNTYTCDATNEENRASASVASEAFGPAMASASVASDMSGPTRGSTSVALGVSGPASASASVTLEVFGPARVQLFSITPTDATLFAGDPADLLCRARGHPLPDVKVTPGVVTVISDVPSADVPSPLTRDLTVKVYQNGVYNCSVNNSNGSDWRAFNVVWSCKPRILDFRWNVTQNGVYVICRARGDPYPSVQLRSPSGGVLVAQSRSDNLDTYLSAFISPFTLATSGDYTCEAKNTCGTDAQTRLIEVDYWEPVYSCTNASLSRDRVTSAELLCEGLGQPRPSVQWRLAGSGVPSLENVTRYMQRTRLSFKDLRLEDAGSYVCEHNQAVECVSTLMVFGKPDVTVPVMPDIVTGPFNVSCSARAYPSANLTLSLPDRTIPVGPSGGIVTNLFVPYTMDPPFCYSGAAVCSGMNSEGSDSESLYFRYGIAPTNVVVDTGMCGPHARFPVDGTGSLGCSAKVAPDGELAWNFDGKPLQGAARVNSTTNLAHCVMTSQLTLANLVCEDTGYYSCNISNRFGQNATGVLLQVLKKPDVAFTFVQNNDSVSLECVAYGCPEMTKLYIRDVSSGVVLSSAVAGDGGPFQKRVSATGNFTSSQFECYAENEAGFATRGIEFVNQNSTCECEESYVYRDALIAVCVAAAAIIAILLIAGCLLYRHLTRTRVHPGDPASAMNLSRAPSYADLTTSGGAPARSSLYTPSDDNSQDAGSSASSGHGSGDSNELSEQQLLSGALPGPSHGQVEE